jgi:Kef-type K+ transport system membrane component KefB
MTTAIIITICVLLLLAYIFDLTSAKTKVPSVILLLLLGFSVRQLSSLLEIPIPDVTSLLPIFGTVGLILIVLEGSLELEFNKSKFSLIRKSFIVSLFPMLALSLILSFLFRYFGQTSFRDSLLNAIPLCIISSAIAIPSVKLLSPFNKEFVIYESSLSDILGVLFFNFIALNDNFGIHSFGHFGLQLIFIIVVSFLATIALAFLLNKIEHHIKFAPIILLIIVIYEISKVYHLPGLIFILLFGLFLGNLDELKQFKWIQKLKPDELDKEVHKFKELTIEATFLVRAFFFLLFGYLIEVHELLNTDTLIWATGIVAGIFLFRAIQLKISSLPLSPLLFIAPRGLITILLFLSITESQKIPLVNKSLIIQVIILTALVMMFGLMAKKTGNGSEETETKEIKV